MLYPFVTQLRPVPANMPIRLILILVLFYLNYFYLVPSLLLRKYSLAYFLTCLALVILLGILMDFYFRPALDMNIPHAMRERMQRELENRPEPFFFRMSGIYLLTLGLPLVVSTVIRMYVEWKKNEDLRKKVETEKIHSELQFLKTQLNPHFLFNSLNAIYSLSVKKSQDTSEAIINLSELMRYMLYEADKEFVPLEKELEYIRNYVHLQRLRLSDSENVSLKIQGDARGKRIPPLLFISFIENAFKYGTDYKGKTNVRITLIIDDAGILLKVTNKIGVYNKHSASSGVGLENVRNRLKLLFPETHNLRVSNDGEVFLVELCIEL